MTDLVVRPNTVPSLGAICEARDGASNNWTFVRFFASLLVLVSHAFPLSGDTSLVEPFAVMTRGQASGGSLAVQIFFFASGFLVTRSLVRAPDLLRYVLARALRIIPGLFVVVMLSILFLGPLFTKLTFYEYFNSSETFRYFKTVRVNIQYVLPGVFEAHPNTAINGSLWSLEIEVLMYAMLPFVVMAFRRKARWLALAAFVAVLVTAQMGGLTVANGFYRYYIFNLAQFFLAGTTAYLWRSRIPMFTPLAVLALAALVLSARLGAFSFVCVTALGYFLLWFVYCASKIFSFLDKIGDLSYGIYIYAFPCQQVAYSVSPLGATWWGNIALALPPTLIFAWLSWTLVERPAMNRRERILELCRAQAKHVMRRIV